MLDYEYWGLGSFSAKTNMALEELMLKKAIKGVAPFRFWDFSKDSVVLGYAQATDAVKKTDNSFDVVRRITGGSHVQTGKNILAYTFAVPRDGSFGSFEDLRAYFADIVAKGLVGLGIENIVVDNKASTIMVDNKIVASHAIIWGIESALLHGLILIDPYDVDKVSERVNLAQRKIGSSVYKEYTALKNLPAVSRLLSSVAPNLDDQSRSDFLKGTVANSIMKNLTNKFEKKQITDSTISEAFDIVNNKHKKSSWIENRKPPFTEDEIEKIPGEELNGNLKKNLGYCLFMQVKNKDFKKMAQSTE